MAGQPAWQLGCLFIKEMGMENEDKTSEIYMHPPNIMGTKGYPANATRYLGNNAFLGNCLGIMMVDNPLIMKTHLYIVGSLPKRMLILRSFHE